MATLMPDALWELIEPLLPLASPKPKGGRLRLSDRACVSGIPPVCHLCASQCVRQIFAKAIDVKYDKKRLARRRVRNLGRAAL
jgi:hypothetical protein